ncbi:hypothetical protein C5167_037891 [Papaver somniferum]|uniref:Uncharacterized protein n=1 Tax=Papaver somniferum TaxID=3469 RepID=A0A4Y7I7N9_PAPSO|nr:uncharacterized protein LOC113291004 [Papaver somniferum]RZC44943.1 hypothetical protein C5167_037891 [Papaver somniferum]
MSRCFPYPPPGYEVKKNGVLDLDLLESIKRDSEKIKKERKKEKKRDKKLKKEQSKESGDTQKKERSHGTRHKSDGKAGDGLKRKELESEQLEKSCLTEDQGQPANTQNLYDSSDSTLNSNKRKRHSSPSDVSRSSGNSVLIKLPLQKHKDIELPTSNSVLIKSPLQKHKDIDLRTSNEQACSVSGRTEIITIPRGELASLRASKQSCSTSGRNELHTQDVHVPTKCSSKSAPRGVDLQFRDLIENWVPPTLQLYRTDFDDQEWLFEVNPQRRHEAKRLKPSSIDIDSCRGSSGWPRACYLPAADIYALPYTVPF